MPTSKKDQQQHQHQREVKPSIDDQVSECVRMYPVFCTANIPSTILDDFIDEAYEGWFEMLGDRTSSGASPCIFQTTDLDSIAHGSRKPMPDFESPFLGMTDDEVRDWMLKHQHPPDFAQSTFTILDQSTVERRVSRIGYAGEIDPDDRMLWADFFADLYVRVPIEMGTTGWDTEELVGTGEVFNRKVIEEQKAEVHKRH